MSAQCAICREVVGSIFNAGFAPANISVITSILASVGKRHDMKLPDRSHCEALRFIGTVSDIEVTRERWV